MARTRQIKPHFLYSASMRKVSVGAQLTFVRLWLLAEKISNPTPSKRPGESAAAREAFESASGMAREPIANKAAEGASGLERTAVLANSGTARDSHERFSKTGAESAADGDSRRLHERLTRTLAFLHNRG